MYLIFGGFWSAFWWFFGDFFGAFFVVFWRVAFGLKKHDFSRHAVSLRPEHDFGGFGVDLEDPGTDRNRPKAVPEGSEN